MDQNKINNPDIKGKHDSLNVLMYVIYYFSALVLSTLISEIILKFLDKIMNIDFFTSVVVNCVISMIVSVAIIFGFVFKDNYRSKSYQVKYILLDSAVAVLVNAVIGFIDGFHPFTSGCARNLGGIIKFGQNLGSMEDFDDVGRLVKLAAFAIISALLVVTSLLSGKAGYNKRLSQQKLLLNHTSQNDIKK